MTFTLNQIKEVWQKYKVPLILAGILALILFPFIVQSDYWRGVTTKIIMYVLIVSSMNVINGYSGQFTVMQAGFVGVGAYTSALMMTKWDVSFWLALIAAGLLASLLGLFVGIMTRKMSGLYLAMVTLGVAEIIRIIALNWTSLTNGPLGVKNIPSPKLFGFSLGHSQAMYFIILIMTALMIFCTYRIIHSKIGRAWISIRENENAAASLGIHTVKYKTINLMYGAFWAGIGGAFMSVYYRYIDSTMFGLDENFNILSMMIIGGMGTLAGPIAGAVVVNLVSEAFRFAAEYRQVLYAIIIIVMMWFRPQGLIGSLEGGYTIRWRKPKKKKASAGTEQKEGVSQ